MVVVEERSSQLLKVSANQRVEYHPGGAFAFVCASFGDLLKVVGVEGHFVPAQKAWRDFFRAWMMDPTADTPSPIPLAPGNP